MGIINLLMWWEVFDSIQEVNEGYSRSSLGEYPLVARDEGIFIAGR